MIKPELLLNVLEKEETILKTLLELEEQTREVLITRDTAALQKLTADKEQLTTEMMELEKRRTQIFPQNITLMEYLQQEDPPGAVRLEELRRSIVDLHDALNSRQKITRRLLLFNQQLVEHAIRLLAPQGGENLYSASGERKQNKTLHPRVVDSRQ